MSMLSEYKLLYVLVRDLREKQKSYPMSKSRTALKERSIAAQKVDAQLIVIAQMEDAQGKQLSFGDPV